MSEENTVTNDSSDEENQRTSADKCARVIAVTSGKGGVGKTNITTNLGVMLAQTGAKVCIFDADTSLANINILLNLAPQKTLEHVLKGEERFEDILLTGPHDLQIVPAASGISEFSNLTEDQQQILGSALEKLEQAYDYILIDTAAGISDTVINFVRSAEYAVIVISPEPTSLTDGFSMVKVLHRRNYEQPIYILVNMATDYSNSMDVFKRFAHAVNKYVHTKVRYLGYIPLDNAVRNAVSAQSPVVLSEPASPAGHCFSLLADIVEKHFKDTAPSPRKISNFWRHQVSILPDQAATEETENTENAESTEIPLEDSAETMPPENTAEATQTTADENSAAMPAEEAPDIDESPAEATATDNDSTVPDSTVPDSLTPATPALDSPQAIAEQISLMVDDAQQTKKQLTELAQMLLSSYQELYNTDPMSGGQRVRPLDARRDNRQTEKKRRESSMLKQSIRYAASVDQTGREENS